MVRSAETFDSSVVPVSSAFSVSTELPGRVSLPG